METIKIIIPLQSTNKEFDNFLGLKFGKSFGEICFTMFSLGFDVSEVWKKRKIVNLVFNPDNHFILDSEINYVTLSFKKDKECYYLIRSVVNISNTEENIDEIIDNNISNIVSNFNLKGKKQKFIDKCSKRYISYNKINEEELEIAFSEQKAPNFNYRFDDIYPFPFWFSTLSGEGCKVRLNDFIKMFINGGYGLRYYKLSEEQTYQQGALVLGIIQSLDSSEFKSFIDFWSIPKNAKLLPELANRIHNSFKSSDKKVSKSKLKEEIKKTILDMQNEILEKREKEKEMKKQENAAKKQEKEAVKNAEIQKLNDDLADL